MAQRTFGGHTLGEIKQLRRDSTDGARFYLALLDAAPDFFALADEVQALEGFIEKMVSTLESVAGEMERRENADALKPLQDLLQDPAIKKIVGS